MTVELFVTPDQGTVIEAQARYVGLAAGRRWGKSFGVLIPRMVKCAVENPGKSIAYIAPSHKLSRLIFDTICDSSRDLIKRTNAQFPFFCTFWTGSKIDFYSYARPKTIRGSGYDLVIVDEIQEIGDPDTFWAVIRPLISDRQGTLMVAGQFRGKNWYYDFFFRDAGMSWDGHEWKRSQGKPGRRAFVFPASSGLMYQSDEGRKDLVDARSAVPKIIYEQEYECIPTANKNAVFHPDDLQACRKGEATDPIKGKKYIAGIDLGAHRDHSAIVILQLPEIHIAYSEEIPIGLRHEQIAHKVGQIVRRYKALPVVDVTGGATGGKAPMDSVVKYYRAQLADMRSYVWNKDNKQHAIRLLSTLLEQRKISIPESHRLLLEELGLYEYEYKDHYYVYHGPKGARDDLVTAMALCVDAWDRGWLPSDTGAPLSSGFM